MYRKSGWNSVLIGLSVVLLTLAAGPVAAQTADLEEWAAGGALPSLDVLVKQALRGEAPAGVTVEELDGGLTQIVIPVSQDHPAMRRKMAKDLINCAMYVGLLEPDFGAGILDFDAAPLANFTYRAGWLVFNTSPNAIDAKTTFKSKGPGPDLTASQTITYRPSAFSLVFGTFQDGWDAGVHALSNKVQGASPGKIKGNICVGCPFG